MYFEPCYLHNYFHCQYTILAFAIFKKINTQLKKKHTRCIQNCPTEQVKLHGNGIGDGKSTGDNGFCMQVAGGFQ